MPDHAGTEQGQGRHLCDCGHGLERHGDDAGGCIECICLDPNQPPSVLPARDSQMSTFGPASSPLTSRDIGRDAPTEPGPPLERDPDGATGVGARYPNWLKDHFELDGDDEPLHEVECPSCGATIRVHMADAPDPGGRDEAREAMARALDTCDVLDRVSNADERTGVPMAQQAARIRRAAVETIRRALLRDGTTT